jgi:voltage-gated potassium channel
MARPPGSRLTRLLERRVQRKGLRPRYAASVIVTLWVIAIVVFGVIERLVEPETFDSVWLGMWWAMQTVTTVGYGDVVPRQAIGKAMAAFLMLGGLSLFAVVTGAITSAFVREAEQRRRAQADPVVERLDHLSAELQEIRTELARGRPPGAG